MQSVGSFTATIAQDRLRTGVSDRRCAMKLPRGARRWSQLRLTGGGPLGSVPLQATRHRPPRA